MIIQCPNCGFPGRVPEHAIGTPHNARCPQCRYRFELDANLPELSLLAAANPSLPGPHALASNGHGDPASSSYELKAITGDFPDRAGREPAAAVWDADDDVDFLEPDPAASVSRTAANSHSPVGARLPAPAGDGSSPRPTVSAGIMDPWYSQVLQVWGIVFLAWAAILLVRSLYVMVAPTQGHPSWEANIIPTVVAVLLLVPGAAGLFLLVDLGRYIRSLRPSPSGRSAGLTDSRPGRIELALRRFRRKRFTPLHFPSS
jgi:hypothetical protein